MPRNLRLAAGLLVTIGAPSPSTVLAVAPNDDEACLYDDDACQGQDGGALSLLQHRKAKVVQNVQASSKDSNPYLDCSGNSFFDCFDFFTGPDPTNGYVKYIDWVEANRFKLLNTNYKGNGGVYIGGFSGIGMQALSVRLESQRTFNSGLFVLDVAHVPTGPGTWPAFWLHGENWPMEGEFDMFESVNDGNTSKTSIHTSPGCLMPSVYGMDNGGNGNANQALEGSGVWGNPAGKVLNDMGGGVIAVWWLTNGFSMYHFPRNKIPEDVVNGSPDPSTWGRPWRFFPFGSDCASSHFKNMKITLNLAFCGEWAGREFPGGNDACVEYLNHNNVPDAYWLINSLRVYSVDGE